MKKLLLLVLLFASCTKEVIIERVVENPINTRLQEQVNELQGTISNLNATNLNLESQISLLESEAAILESDIENERSEVSELEDRVEELEIAIERYNIELERSTQDSFLRLTFNQLQRSYRVLNVGSYVLPRIGVYDSAESNVPLWFEDDFNLPGGKEISFSETGGWDFTAQIRIFYDVNGELSVVVAYLPSETEARNARHFYIEAYDYIYELEDELEEFLTN